MHVLRFFVRLPGLQDVKQKKDACADDALWLVSSVVQYIRETGEFGFLDETVTYADGGEGSVYEHLRRILDFSARQVGQNGICKGLRADWNDCLNLGGGESAMVSFLHLWALNNFCELADYLGRAEDAAYYRVVSERVKRACRDVLWDGKWFLRGITADNRRIGTRADTEGRVHMESNPWAWVAEAKLGRGSHAMKFYNALCPALQNDKIEIRKAEPYSYCQFIAGKGHTAFGRAHHPFMTGSAGWAYYAATQYLLGVRPEFDRLTVDPCIPADWREFHVHRVWRDAVYEIHVQNPDGVEKGVRSIIVDGKETNTIPALPAGGSCRVEVIMG